MRPLVARFVLACLILLGGIGGSFAVQRYELHKSDSYAATINEAGRQRMRSQRIALLAEQLVHAPPNVRDALRARLRRVADRMRARHRELRAGSPAFDGAGRLRSIEERHEAVDPRVERYTDDALTLAGAPDEALEPEHEALVRIRGGASDNLLSELDALVEAYQRAADERVLELQQLSTTLLASSVLAVLLTAVFVFWPMAKRIRRDVEELDAINAELEQRVAERTREAEERRERVEQVNAELEDYAAELQRSNRELDDFAYVASHDLKAPLRDVDNLSGWLLEDLGETVPEGSQKHLTQLRARVTRMETLLDDLLRYSRAGRMHGEIGEVDLNALVTETADQLHVPEGFEVVAPEGLPILQGPKTPLQQVLRNLMSNAIKHHDAAEGRIEIEARELGEHVELRVADDGPGIPEEMHERVFRMFQTLRPRDEVEGSGMGLALVKKLVETYGGRIEIEAREPRGTAFRFTWPRRWQPKGNGHERQHGAHPAG